MSAIDKVIDYHIDRASERDDYELNEQARAELAALRAQAAELQSAHVYLDESPINDPDAPPMSLADRCAVLVTRIAEQARQLDEAREIIEHGATVYTGSVNHNSAFNAMCRDWLAANAPAPQAEQEQTK